MADDTHVVDGSPSAAALAAEPPARQGQRDTPSRASFERARQLNGWRAGAHPRGRIRTVQATKKITRAMELIAGVADRQGPAACARRCAVLGEDHRGRQGPRRGRRCGTDLPLLAGRRRVGTTCYVAIAADRGLVGGYNAGVQRATEGEVKADVLDGKRYLIVPVGRKAEGYFRFRGYTLGERVLRVQRQPALLRRQGDRRARHRSVHAAVRSTRSSSSTPASSPPATQEVVLRPLVPLTAETVAGGDGQAGAARTGRPATTSSSPTRPRSSTRCCRATSRPASTPPCSTPRPPSTPSASGR